MASIQILIDGKRPKTKAEIKRALADDVLCDSISLVDHSMFNNFGAMFIDKLPVGEYYFAGPDCLTDRKWYGSIKVTAQKITVH